MRGLPDVAWFNTGGERMREEDWANPHSKCLTVRLAPVLPDEPSLLIMLNASHVDVRFIAPPVQSGRWVAILATDDKLEGAKLGARARLTMPARTLVVWEWRA